jgi:hypothetical protein
MKKSYSFRLDCSLIDTLDNVEPNRTLGVTNAIQLYLDKTTNVFNSNTEVIQILKDQVLDLKNDKDLLQKRLDYFMLPWYHRLLLKHP